jgi:glycosyltransferase involved in cell wall biosynthesis
MKKVMFVVPFLSSGGAERVVSIWTSELAKLGVDTNLLLFYRVEDEYPLNEDVIVHIIEENKEKYDKLSKIEKIKLLRLKLKSVNPDVIIPFISHVGLMTNIARVGLKTKMIETIRIDPKYSPKNKVVRMLRNISVLLSNCCIVQNEEQKNYFPKWMHKKIYEFANPISDEFLQVERTMSNSGVRSITAVGRLEHQKNYTMLINAFSKLRNLDLILNIYGEGSLKGELQSLINELGLSNHIKVWGRSNNIKEVFLSTDLFVLSSNAEGMPNSLMEAMAVGLPCISTDCPTGPSDLIDNDIDGVLIPVGNEEALINAINSMVNNPKEAFMMGKRAKEKMKSNYAAAVSAKKLLRFLNAI